LLCWEIGALYLGIYIYRSVGATHISVSYPTFFNNKLTGDFLDVSVTCVIYSLPCCTPKKFLKSYLMTKLEVHR